MYYLDKKNEEDLEKLYLKTKQLVTELFKDKLDKENKPYINHLIRVSCKMNTIEGKILGLLHDTIEDIENISYNDLESIGVTKEILSALKLVTKEKSIKTLSKIEKKEKYNKQIDKIINSNNLLAIDLKISDISDNYNKKRIEALDLNTQEWFKLKYEKNLLKLKKKRNEML